MTIAEATPQGKPPRDGDLTGPDGVLPASGHAAMSFPLRLMSFLGARMAENRETQKYVAV